MFKDCIKYSLKFFIRLIIFYIFIIFLNHFTTIGMINVYASEIVREPVKMQFYETDKPVQQLNYSSFIKAGNTFYGYKFSSLQTREAYSWVYNVPSSLNNSSYDFNFVMYNSLWSDLIKPSRVIVKDNGSGIINSCIVSDSSKNFRESTLTQPGSNFNVVTCENVQITGSTTFEIFLYDSFQSATNTQLGISAISIKSNLSNSTSNIESKVDESNKTQKDTNDTIKDDNVDSSTEQGSSFFDDFDSGDEGSLTDIISLPLQYVQSLNDTCKSFTIPLGFINDNITIPCLSSIWSNTSFANVINTASVVLNGFICYKVLISLFYFFKDLKDPDSDKVEVMDL